MKKLYTLFIIFNLFVLSLVVAPIKTPPILDMDAIFQLHMQLDFESEKPTLSILAAQVSDPHIINHPIWSKDKDECGLLDVEPVWLTGRVGIATEKLVVSYFVATFPTFVASSSLATFPENSSGSFLATFCKVTHYFLATRD